MRRRSCSCRRSSRSPRLSRCWPAVRGRSQLRPAPDAEPAAVPVRRRRRAGAVAGRRAVVPGVRRSGAAGAHSRGDRQQPRSARRRWRASKRRARAPASRSRSCTRRSTASRSYGVRQASNASARANGDDDTTHQSGVVRLPAVLGARSVRPPPARAGGGAGAGAGERAGPPRRARHAGRRRRVELLPAARARPAARDRARDAPPQRRDGRPTSGTGWTAACRIGSSSIGSRPTARGRPRRFPRSSGRSRIVENAHLAAARPAAGTDHARRARASASALPPPIPRRPARVAARAAARRRRRPSSCSWRPTPTSAPPRRCSSRRSA